VLGLDNAGKTTILKKLSDEDITTIMPTQASTKGPQGNQAASQCLVECRCAAVSNQVVLALAAAVPSTQPSLHSLTPAEQLIGNGRRDDACWQGVL